MPQNKAFVITESKNEVGFSPSYITFLSYNLEKSQEKYKISKTESTI